MPKRPPRSNAKLNSQPESPGLIGGEGPENISAMLAARPRQEPTDEEIRARAYEMYLERGGQDGLDLDDWVRAERELRKQR